MQRPHRTQSIHEHPQIPVIAGKLGERNQASVTDSATFTTPQADDEELGDLLLEVRPGEGSTIGNLSAREVLSRAAERDKGYGIQEE